MQRPKSATNAELFGCIINLTTEVEIEAPFRKSNRFTAKAFTAKALFCFGSRLLSMLESSATPSDATTNTIASLPRPFLRVRTGCDGRESSSWCESVAVTYRRLKNAKTQPLLAVKSSLFETQCEESLLLCRTNSHDASPRHRRYAMLLDQHGFSDLPSLRKHDEITILFPCVSHETGDAS
jgi:hypothetical protein